MRSLLFLPATAPQMLAKAASRGADALIVDLEDSVPPQRKAEARALAADAIGRLHGQAPLLLRVNADPQLWQADLDAVPLGMLDGLMLPKTESAAQVAALNRAVQQQMLPGLAPLPVVALIETAMGVLHAEAIAAGGNGLQALGFGAEDFAAEMGVAPRPASLLWPAQRVTLCARAYGMACWGLPGSIAGIDDMAAFAELVATARDTGFTGTVCVHPRQVPVANAGFGPTPQEIDWARRVVRAADEARSRGQGAIQLDGRMIDLPVVERARLWLDTARQACVRQIT